MLKKILSIFFVLLALFSFSGCFSTSPLTSAAEEHGNDADTYVQELENLATVLLVSNSIPIYNIKSRNISDELKMEFLDSRAIVLPSQLLYGSSLESWLSSDTYYIGNPSLVHITEHDGVYHTYDCKYVVDKLDRPYMTPSEAIAARYTACFDCCGFLRTP